MGAACAPCIGCAFAPCSPRLFGYSLTTVVILCAGLALGFRFQQGLLAGLAWLMVPVIFGWHSRRSSRPPPSTPRQRRATGDDPCGGESHSVNTLGIFFCTGFVPLDQYPQWIQPVVEHQPMSYAIEAMRGIVAGRPDLGPMMATLLWAGGIVAVCVVPMVIGYRKREHAVMFPASESSRKLAPSEEMFAQSQTFFGSTSATQRSS